MEDITLANQIKCKITRKNENIDHKQYSNQRIQKWEKVCAMRCEHIFPLFISQIGLS